MTVCCYRVHYDQHKIQRLKQTKTSKSVEMENKHRNISRELKRGETVVSVILTVKVKTFNNIRSVAVNSQFQVKDRVRFVELSFPFHKEMYLSDGMHLSGKRGRNSR